MVLYHGRVKNKFSPNKIQSTMTSNKNMQRQTSNNETKYVKGSGIGATNRFSASALKRRATDKCCENS